MSDYIIKVENLSKSYQIKHQNAERYTALRDVITNNVKHMGGRLLGRRNGHGPTQETFWALNDVSFEVKPGERVGIIGRNGAGKSTLLKILSRITEPTSGRVRLRGRVASLLEVGTGFHPELTGRENIFLNGAILGMTRDEIKRKFDEIVAFAEVEQFLDTPVKRYSSGMYVRLAFAVAAHLEPEILVVDEVLAVGDAAFQKKCLGKMEDVASEGRTVLFVSHNMAAVRRLCQRGILLEKGFIKSEGLINQVANAYENYSFVSKDNNSHLFPIINTEFNLVLEALDAKVFIKDEHAHLRIVLKLNSTQKLTNIGITVRIHNYDGYKVAQLGCNLTRNIIQEIYGAKTYILETQNISSYISGGEYSLTIIISFPRGTNLIIAEHIARFQIPVLDIYGSGVPFENHIHGLVPLPLKLLGQ
ncbi:MAG: ABC transporter ATP-binding protein [Anaerolineaceae bacterium]|nr:ABC transporter ATP-binding protein [Anaerolineaceae bacterium]